MASLHSRLPGSPLALPRSARISSTSIAPSQLLIGKEVNCRRVSGQSSLRIRATAVEGTTLEATTDTQIKKDDGNVAGKTVIVTGANTGMGVVIAEVLALKGANVVMACRNEQKGISALKKVNFSLKEQRRRGEREEEEQGSATLGIVDLASLDSVRQFAVEIMDRYSHVDQLICNAGIMIPPHSLTQDGFESQFQVNHLSHYLLTRLLMPTLLNSLSRPTIVHISSLAGENGSISKGEFWDIAKKGPEDYSAWTAYRQSKLAQVLFTVETNRRYGEQVTVNAVHPGIVNTELFNRNASPLMKAVMDPLGRIMEGAGLVYSPEKGASTAIYLATQPASVTSTGGYWADCAPRPANPVAFDRELGVEWWEESAKAAGIENEN